MRYQQFSDIKVTSLSNKGLGVIRILHRSFLVEGVYPGDIITVEADLSSPTLSLAKLLSLDFPSPSRIKAPCPHFAQCRGCALMELAYDEQLKIKADKLHHHLTKNKLDTTALRPMIPSPKKLGYRSRGQFKVSSREIGYADKFGESIVPISTCPILDENAQMFLKDLHLSLPNDSFTPGEGHAWNFLDFNSETTIHNFALNSRLPFAQGNEDVNALMKNWLWEKIQTIPPHSKVVEFFCGSGNFTEVLATKNDIEIIAFEVQGVALKKLSDNKLPNVKIIEADLFKSNSWKKIQADIREATIWLLDPPRSGLNYQRAWIKAMPKLTDIFYISCDPETLARDIAQFVKLGFKLEEIRPIDQFPQTIHFEILAHLVKD